MFYDKTIDILGEPVQTSNGFGGYSEGIRPVIKSIECDVQPYSSQLFLRDYGYDIQCTKRVFCDVDSTIVEGKYVGYNGKEHKIVKIIEWEEYMEVMIDGI